MLKLRLNLTCMFPPPSFFWAKLSADYLHSRSRRRTGNSWAVLLLKLLLFFTSISTSAALQCYDLKLKDSYGDGWNGATFRITNSAGSSTDGITYDGSSHSSVTVSTGYSNAFTLCMNCGCYDISAGGGSYDSEISW